MIFILLIIVLLALLIALFFMEAARVTFVFDTEKSDMNATVSWLYPMIKVIATMENNKPKLSFYLFKKFVFSKVIKKKHQTKNRINILKVTNPQDIQIMANYGFSDPLVTGITCGAIGVASQLINIDSLGNNPDFTTDNNYIYIDAAAKVNLGSAIVNLFKQKF